MDSLLVFSGLLFLVVLIGAILGWISFFKAQGLTHRILMLESALMRLREQQATEKNIGSPEIKKKTPTPIAPSQEKTFQPETGIKNVSPSAHNNVNSAVPSKTEVKVEPQKQSNVGQYVTHIHNNWMVWLGGVCVGLAGIFLVRYSIEAGLLGPTQRIVAAVVGGIALHVLAEWLRIKTGEPHPAFAALAGGASIMLYASMLAALHLYSLLSPGFAFSALALISIITMFLALRNGPVLAALGIIGAYVVPVFVSDSSGNIVGAMIYSLIISGAALLLMRYVYRVWLWYGMLFGGLGWWLISLTAYQADGFRGIYLAIFAYLIIAVPFFDWLLNKGEGKEQNNPDGLGSLSTDNLSPLTVSLFFLVIAQTFSICFEPFTHNAIYQWAPLYIILIWVCGHRPSLKYLPWLSLVCQWFAWLYCGLDYNGNTIQLRGLSTEVQNTFLVYMAGMIAIYSGLSLVVSRAKEFSRSRSSLIALAPVLWFALAYLLVTDVSIKWEWSVVGIVLGIGYLLTAHSKLKHNPYHGSGVWLVLAGHFAFSLAAAMFFRQATLTLVLATQVVSLVYIMKKFNMDSLKWLIKGVLALVVIRLTLNPWLLHYPQEVHWSLWTYGGTTLCCGFAAWRTGAELQLKKWLEAATLHLLVLFLVAETRYLLYDGNIFIEDYTLLEASINTMLWSALGLVYYYRANISTFLQGYYSICSKILLCMSIANFALVLTVLNPLWEIGAIASTPIWNLLLLAYGGPVIMSGLALFFFDQRYRKVAASLLGVSLFVFINIEIRHLWQPGLYINLPVSDGELYTYSIVWLVMAIVTILLATRASKQAVYKAGMALLIVVIAKIFFVDMSDLQGLLRVASFMGLGLSLLGLAYLHQKISTDVENPDKS